MLESLDDERVLRVVSLSSDEPWRADLERLAGGDHSLTRRTAGEDGIRSVQRLLAFLGYSTSASGAFSIDGDFGRGTNRGVAQFQWEHGLNPLIDRAALTYPCTFQTARKRIVAIPEARLDLPTLDAMLEAARRAIDAGEVTFGDFEEALFHLNQLDRRQLLDCRAILARYGGAVDAALGRLRAETGAAMRREWVLAIIRQETAGVVRPRFEQHKLSKAAAKNPDGPLPELRVRSMSIGLGQIMGFNHAHVGAPSARAMLSSPVEEQVLYIARFLAPKRAHLASSEPTADDFRAIARFYNGPAFASHFYDEALARWFREFRILAAGDQ